MMIKEATIYWASTLLLSAMLLVSAYTYFFHKETIEGVRRWASRTISESNSVCLSCWPSRFC